MRIAVLVAMAGSTAMANTHRPRLEEFVSTAPGWAKDCTLDLVEVGDSSFSVAVACRGSEELVFERRAKQGGPKSGTVTSFDGATRVLAWRTNKYSTDVYSCTSTADQDPAARCKALVDAFGQSTVIRRGAAAFARPKS